MLNDKKYYAIDNFRLKKTHNKVIIRHRLHENFELIANYGGRSWFQVDIPPNWKTEGLAGNNNEDDYRNGLSEKFNEFDK